MYFCSGIVFGEDNYSDFMLGQEAPYKSEGPLWTAKKKFATFFPLEWT